MDSRTDTSFDGACSGHRASIKLIGESVLRLKKEVASPGYLTHAKADTGEMIANITLAYRHLEDAAMRLGKAIQAYEGGVSIYDSNDAKRIAEAGTFQEQQSADNAAPEGTTQTA